MSGDDAVHDDLPRTDETDIFGARINQRGIDNDPDVSDRVRRIISNLTKIGSIDGGWSELYHDPRDNRLWEMTRPFSGWHGGGPFRLTWISPGYAAQRYGKHITSKYGPLYPHPKEGNKP